ncbi:MAG: InlB B-repeat-containing protein, partial [Oscillospiraceae bacterium]|nr:InlB B-repeat-containing protein [Oscillospiraceae bacterium]
PTEEAPSQWSREGYTLVGWLASDNQTVYSYEELLSRPVTADVTYTAQWRQFVTVRFDTGQYSDSLYPIDPMEVSYGSQITLLPTPGWKNNSVGMAFDGWYLNSQFTQPVTSDYVFYEDTTLYAKWSPKEDGYYIYFMDFFREGQTPLVLMTYSVTENKTASPYTPGNEPEGTQWDGKWYLDKGCANPYNFQIPVSQMEGYLTGANGRDLYLYPGTQEVCRAIFVTYGTKVDPVTIPIGGSINLDQYKPERQGYEFAGWTLKDGTPLSGVQKLSETTTFYAKWNAGYVPFEAILRIENANDTGMTQADILGTWYAKAGSQIRVKSTYSGSGNNRTGTHQIVCVVDGVEYPVYTNVALTQKATLSDVYATYFIYNNTGTTWTDEVNWDDVYTGGEVPYSTRPISSAGDTIINFDYMRVRNDIVFTIVNSSSGAYLDIYKLYRDGLITGSVTYTGTKPTSTGQNVSATGVSAQNIHWSYTAATRVGSSYNNYYTLHNMKYGQRIYEVYPVGGSWLTPRNNAFHWYSTSNNQLFSSRREDLSADFFSGSGRKLSPYSLTAVFAAQDKIALMYAVECLPGETADFTISGVGYKVQTQLCEVVNHTGDFTQKELLGCVKESSASYTNLNTTTSKLGGTSVKTLFGTTYWNYYNIYGGVNSLSDIDKAYIFYYTRLHMNIQFNLGYDSNGNGANETVKYENIAYGERIGEYQFGMPDYEEHSLLSREGYEFAGWLDANGFVLEAEDWESMVATGDSENNTMIFIAKWEKISNNIVEYYDDRSSTKPFESHYFDDGELIQYPTMSVYPQGWVWQEYGEGQFQRFDWDVPMYGEYGVQETRIINGEERVVNVIRIYGTWDESHTKVVYDPNAPQGGIPGTAPTDANEYTIWQSEVPVASKGETANTDPDMIFAGWLLDRNGIVYHPGDHVPVRWPRTMIFTAQWAKPEDVVYLRYDPNGGTPTALYPSETGFAFKKNATAAVWDNTGADGTAWFSRTGYVFIGWNTQPDGSGTAYTPDAPIVLTAPVTTLYAQWKSTTFTLSVHKVDSESKEPLDGAEFGLYRKENGEYIWVQSISTGVDGHITFLNLATDTVYKLVEEKPPNGYGIIAKEIIFALRPNGNTVSLQFYDSSGNVISAPNGVSGAYTTGNQLLAVTVKNLRGYKLPSTGGAGIFYILCGLFLVSAPLVYGFSLRRRYERRSER